MAASLLIGAGVLGLVWVVLVWQWQDPFTALYTTWQQHELQGQLDRLVARQQPVRLAAQATSLQNTQSARQKREARIRAERQSVARAATAFQRSAVQGQAVGRIVIPRIGLNVILVDGTDESALTRGPGLDRRTSMPGRNRLVYIAGHRTTYLAPFSHIDEIGPGSVIRLEMPYATFIYRAYNHQIVPATDLSMLAPVGHELLRLQACHPRFFATERYIVNARLVRVEPNGLPSWRVAMPATASTTP